MALIVTRPRSGGTAVVKETAIGVIDGINDEFETSRDYVLNTLSVFLNGLRERHITQLGNKKFKFDQSVRAGSTIDVEYLPY